MPPLPSFLHLISTWIWISRFQCYAPKGVHVCHVVLDGVIASPNTKGWASKVPSKTWRLEDYGGLGMVPGLRDYEYSTPMWISSLWEKAVLEKQVFPLKMTFPLALRIYIQICLVSLLSDLFVCTSNHLKYILHKHPDFGGWCSLGTAYEVLISTFSLVIAIYPNK